MLTRFSCRITALVPAMQIHLHDCRSNNALQSGLAANKLQLCMLFLENISGTYWSAGVMYRLFERARNILNAVNHTNSSNSTQTKNSSVYVRNDNVIRPYTPPRNFEYTTPPTSHPNGYGPAGLEMVSNTWPNQEDMNLDAIDQLLNPDFALRDDNYEVLFSGFGLSGLGLSQPFPGVQTETGPGMLAIS